MENPGFKTDTIKLNLCLQLCRMKRKKESKKKTPEEGFMVNETKTYFYFIFFSYLAVTEWFTKTFIQVLVLSFFLKCLFHFNACCFVGFFDDISVLLSLSYCVVFGPVHSPVSSGKAPFFPVRHYQYFCTSHAVGHIFLITAFYSCIEEDNISRPVEYMLIRAKSVIPGA